MYIVLNEFYNLLVVRTVLVAYASALRHFEPGERNLDRFQSFAVHRGREDQRIVSAVIFVGKDAMVHGFALLPELLDALQDPDMNFTVRKVDPEKLSFGLPVFVLAFQFPAQAFFFGQCLLIFPFLHDIAVVLCSQVGGTHVPGISQVFAEKAQ